MCNNLLDRGISATAGASSKGLGQRIQGGSRLTTAGRFGGRLFTDWSQHSRNFSCFGTCLVRLMVHHAPASALGLEAQHQSHYAAECSMHITGSA